MGSSVSSGHVEASPGTWAEPDVILTVFWCGTGGTISGLTTQVGLFYQQCQAQELSALKDDAVPRYLKMGFDGCGVTNGTGGTVFAFGLSDQCESVVKVVQSLLKRVQHVRINCLGLSRGGMACLMLAKLLVTREVDPNRVELNMLLFDPVPGNGISSVAVDLFGWSIASSCMDLSQCSHLNQVVAIYPHEPLPALAFHAPILPRYPSHAQVEEDVWLGCHQGALQTQLHFLDSKMSYYRIREFLTSVGSLISMEIDLERSFLLGAIHSMFKHQINAANASTRDTHSFAPTVILRKPSGRYLNKFHRRLLLDAQKDEKEEKQTESKSDFVLVIHRPKGK